MSKLPILSKSYHLLITIYIPRESSLNVLLPHIKSQLTVTEKFKFVLWMSGISAWFVYTDTGFLVQSRNHLVDQAYILAKENICSI